MKTFDYIIKDKAGIHARPAGMLVNKVKEFSSSVYVEKDGKRADARRLMMLMSLGVAFGDKITVMIEGADEENACEYLKDFFETTL